MASMNKKEKKELMDKISGRIEREKNSFNDKLNEFGVDNMNVDILDNMVRQFYDALDKDYFSVKDSLDPELVGFFNQQYFTLGIMEKIVYEFDPKIFSDKVVAYSNKIANEYNICVNSNADFSSHLDEFQNLLRQLKSFIYRNIHDDKEFANDERFKPVIDEAKKSIENLEQQLVELEKKNNLFKDKAISGRKKGSNNGLMDKYMLNFYRDLDSIINMYPDKKLNLIAIGALLTKLKNDNGAINEDLTGVRESLLKDFDYDIENGIVNKKISVVDKDENKEDVKHESKSAGYDVINDDDINYTSLAVTIKSYIKNFEDNQPIILNNGAPGTADEKYVKFSKYRDVLLGLLKETSDKSRSSVNIKKDFLNVTKEVDKDLGYLYNSNKKPRRRKVSFVKRAALGIGGIVIGNYGITLLASQWVFYNKVGYAFSSNPPYFRPIALIIISIIMLKKALSSKEKSIILKVYEKLKKEDKIEEMIEFEKDGTKGKKRR